MSNFRERATFAQAGSFFLTSEGNSALLPASARDQTVTKGDMIMVRLTFTSSARRVYQTVSFFHDEESYITNHLMTDLLGNSEFFSLESRCFPRLQLGKISRFSGNKIFTVSLWTSH